MIWDYPLYVNVNVNKEAALACGKVDNNYQRLKQKQFL